MAEPAAQPGRPGRPRVVRATHHVLGPLWRTTFRDPVREGRLRLTGLSAVERQAARFSLVALVVVLGSALLGGRLRHGELLVVASRSNEFVPATVLGLTLVALTLAWVAITWGGLRASGPVRVAVGVGYLLFNADFAVDLAGVRSHSWILEHYEVLQQIGFYAPAAALVVAGLTARWRRLDRWVVPLGRVVCVAGAAMLFLGQLWVHAVQVDQGRLTTASVTTSGAMLAIGQLLLPLLYISAIAVIDFALDVSTSLTEPAAALGRRWLLVGVLVLAAVKLWFEVGARADYWRTGLAEQPQAIARAVASVVLLALLTAVVTRFRHSEDSLEVKEDLTLGSSLALSVPFVGQIVVLMAGVVAISAFNLADVPGWWDDWPANWLNTWGIFIAFAVAVVVGVVLMRRSRGGLGDELGSGLVVVGAWGTVAGANANLGFNLGFSYRSVDVTVTLLVLLLVLVSWRRAGRELLITALTVLLFTWLVTSRGDYLSFVGGLVGLSSVVVVVFGIVWTLLSGSSFTTGSSRWLPQPARPLLFLGYVLLSAAILSWSEATHTTQNDSDGLTAYFALGIPLAAWLLGRRILTRPAPAVTTGDSAFGGEPGPLAEEVGDGVASS